MLVGALGMPSPGLAAEVFPEGAESSSPTQSAVVLSVSAEQWNAPRRDAQVSRAQDAQERPQEKSPRSGKALVTLPGLLAVMQNVVQQPGSGVALHYPEDERGEVWVEELRDWLVALGLSSSRIQLIPGSSGDVINISQVVVMKNPPNGKNRLPQVITEPFQIKEATGVVNGVEIP